MAEDALEETGTYLHFHDERHLHPLIFPLVTPLPPALQRENVGGAIGAFTGVL